MPTLLWTVRVNALAWTVRATTAAVAAKRALDAYAWADGNAAHRRARAQHARDPGVGIRVWVRAPTPEEVRAFLAREASPAAHRLNPSGRAGAPVDPGPPPA